jgi:hypothetical protein
MHAHAFVVKEQERGWIQAAVLTSLFRHERLCLMYSRALATAAT